VIVPSEEEFGLVSLEAQAAGTPVIAYDAGGARATVVDEVTGVRFSPQTAAGLVAGITRFSQLRWNRDAIQNNAARFGYERFEKELLALIEGHLEGRSDAYAASLRRSDAV
jgi:glycosyltransferase involved in cell wall biosynthesis